MRIVPLLIVGLLSLLHVYIMILEMFLWTRPYGRKAFALTEPQAESTRVLAANQGLYNGFLAAGLFWGLWPQTEQLNIMIFFLMCVLFAGVYGSATVHRKILWIQGVPAAVGLLSLYLF